MIHICKSKDNQFYVIVTADNGEVLSQSETLKTKPSVYKNIRSQSKQFGNSGLGVSVQDNTLPNPKIIKLIRNPNFKYTPADQTEMQSIPERIKK